jgi:uncharacterized protein YjbI with pentapeptide repeats
MLAENEVTTMGKAEKKREFWRERRERIKHKWAVPFVFIEWNCERLSDLLERLAFLEVLEHLGRLTIVVAVVFYFTESGSRRKAKHYQAWQVINSAQGKTGSGGRMDALQDLCRDRVSLAGVDISKANLPRLNLEDADLAGADFAEANLMDAKLARAKLIGANLANADLSRTTLSEANLFRANLIEANFLFADLSGAGIEDANLCDAMLARAKLVGASLWGANLAGANLRDVNLAGANLQNANLPGANLMYANLTNIEHWQEIRSIKHANIYGVTNAPEGFIEWATASKQGAVSIEDEDEWKNSIGEKKKQEAENNRGDQKKAGEK